MRRHKVSLILSGWLCIFLILTTTAACRTPDSPRGTATTTPVPYTTTATIVSGNLTRNYIVHLPPHYNQTHALPLVLAFHGGGGTGKSMDGLTHFNRVADEKNFIVVYPDGYQKHWGDGRGTSPSERDGVDDVAFISALIDTLSTQYHIDPKRVYATGISNGGFFSQRLGCQLATKIAAIAVVAATMPLNLAQTCQPGRPVPMVLMHGTADPLVSEAGGTMTVGEGGKILSTTATVTLWRNQNKCNSTSTKDNLPTTVDDGTQVQRELWNGCDQNASVIFYNIINGGHTWPNGPQYLPTRIIGKTSHNLDATQTIWDFFQAHPRP